MCVIICKPKGAAMPSQDTLLACWMENPHGAGYAICRAGETATELHKGFMDYYDLCYSLDAENIQPDDLVILHFRIATAGKIDGPTCHPFPVSDSVKALRALDLYSDRIVAHNGIIDNNPPELLSDTQKFILQVLSKMSDFTHLDIDTRGKIGWSKLAMLDRGVLRLAGDGWTVEADGCIYSNLNWRRNLETTKQRRRAKRRADREARELARMEREWMELNGHYFGDTFSEELEDEWLYPTR